MNKQSFKIGNTLYMKDKLFCHQTGKFRGDNSSINITHFQLISEVKLQFTAP